MHFQFQKNARQIADLQSRSSAPPIGCRAAFANLFSTMPLNHVNHVLRLRNKSVIVFLEENGASVSITVTIRATSEVFDHACRNIEIICRCLRKRDTRCLFYFILYLSFIIFSLFLLI